MISLSKSKFNAKTALSNQVSRLPLGLVFVLLACFFSTHAQAQETDNKVVNETGLSEAAENLSKILKQAKEKGLVQTKEANGQKDSANQTRPNSEFHNVIASTVNCDIGEVLRFKSLQPIEVYEDLTVAKSVSDEMKGLYGALHLARVQLSLGLNTEAKATLAPFENIEAQLLKRVAHLITHPHSDVDELVISPFVDCNTHTKIWSILETDSYLDEGIEASERRQIVNDLSEFPKYLRETVSVNLAIKAAEKGEMKLARNLWQKMDTEARENGTRLPEEKHDRHDFLYLNGLLNKDSDPDFYTSVLNYLSEREGEFRLTALTQLSKESRETTAKINSTLEDDLLEVSQNFSKGSESQLAAFELVKNRIYVGRAIDAIIATEKYFAPSDTEFRQSVLEITELVQNRLKSEDSLKRLTGLNDYLFDTAFFEEGGNTDDLKSEALKAAVAVNLPELHKKIFENQEEIPEETQLLFNQAVFFTNLKTGNPVNKTEVLKDLDLNQKQAKQTTQQALANNDMNLARSVAARLPDNDMRRSVIQDIAWVEGRWADTTASDGTIVEVLTTPVQTPISTADRQWIKRVPSKISAVENTLETTRDYLKNG